MIFHARTRRSTFQRALGVLALLVALCLSSAVNAQGTGGSLPDPMSSRDLDYYMQRLHLDEAQRRAAETFHEQYLEQFMDLREGDIEKFMEKTQSMQGSMPTRKALEDVLNEMERLQKRIARLDDQFFDQLLPILGENQQLDLTRARMHRARERFSNDMAQMIGFLIPAAGVDLSDIYGKYELSQDEQLMIQSVVMEYESKLTRSRREISEAIASLFLDAMKMLEENGITEETFSDPAKAQDALKMMRDMWATLSGNVMGLGMEVSDLNRKTCKRLADLLPGENGDQLVRSYYTRAYPELPKSNLPNLFKKALRYKDLTDEQWASISVLRDEHNRQERKLFDDMADVHDQLRATKSPFDFGGMGGAAPPQNDEAVDKLADLGERHTKLTDRTTEALNTLLGADLQAKIMQQPDGDFGMAKGGAELDPEDMAIIEAKEAAAAAEMAENQLHSEGDQPISLREFKNVMAQLDLDDATRAVAEQLHATYLERFKSVSSETTSKMMEEQQKMWKYDEATSTTRGPSVDQVEKVAELRKHASEAMREVDAQFFRDLALTCGTDPVKQEQLEMVRQMRERATYRVERNMWGWGYGMQRSETSRIDLIELCLDEQLLDDPSSELRSVLTTYQASINDAMRKRYEVGLEVQRMMERGSAEMFAANQARAARGEDNEGFDMEASMRYQEAMREVNKKMQDASTEVVQLNASTLETLKAALPEEQAAQLEKAFKRKAYPSVYKDAEMMEKVYAKARSLGSLSDSQRERLDALLTEHQQKDEALRERMIEALSRSTMSSVPGDQEQWREYQKTQNAMERLRFESDELMARTRRRVQDMLTDEQLAQLGGPLAEKTVTQVDKSSDWDE